MCFQKWVFEKTKINFPILRKKSSNFAKTFFNFGEKSFQFWEKNFSNFGKIFFQFWEKDFPTLRKYAQSPPMVDKNKKKVIFRMRKVGHSAVFGHMMVWVWAWAWAWVWVFEI